jgi:hypothetical protein
MLINCFYCGSEIEKEKTAIRRALKRGYGLFCDQTCSGLNRRLNKSKAQKKEEKRLYDIEYRKKNRESIRAKKSAYFKKSYQENPDKYRLIRKNRQQKHNKYCRSPEYREYKKKYDEKYQATKKYGEFWESAIIHKNICLEIDRRQADFENGTFNKSQKRKRELKTVKV